VTEHAGDPLPDRRGAIWLLVTGVLLVSSAALGAVGLVADLPAPLGWAWVVLACLGAAAATVTTVVVARSTGVSVPRTLGRALLAPVRFLLQLP
jgi:VIT1/CCC1 family predicted Fe2+/Mn2+ transporter